MRAQSVSGEPGRFVKRGGSMGRVDTHGKNANARYEQWLMEACRG